MREVGLELILCRKEVKVIIMQNDLANEQEHIADKEEEVRNGVTDTLCRCSAYVDTINAIRERNRLDEI